jgi:hypothetical protein
MSDPVVQRRRGRIEGLTAQSRLSGVSEPDSHRLSRSKRTPGNDDVQVWLARQLLYEAASKKSMPTYDQYPKRNHDQVQSALPGPVLFAPLQAFPG